MRCASLLALFSILGSAPAPPARAQAAVTVIRFVTAREGGPVPIGETATFEPTEAKAVAWAQFEPPTDTHTIVFRWFDPQRRLHRASPVRILVPGEEFLWDDLPIRGQPAANLPGLWAVELYADDRLAATVRFTIVPPPVAPPPPVAVQHQTTLSTRGELTRTGTTSRQVLIHSLDHRVQFLRRDDSITSTITTASAGRLWGTSEGFRGLLSLGYLRAGLFSQAGVEGSRITDLLFTPPLRLDTGSAFLDLRYSQPQFPFLSLSYRSDRVADDALPRLTDSLTRNLTFSASHFIPRLSLSGTYVVQDVDDLTAANVDFRNRTLTLSAVYFPSPRLFVFATRTRVMQDFGATAFAAAFRQTTDTTSTRLQYQLHPSLSLALFTLSTGVSRSDALFTLATAQRGAEAVYRWTPVVTLRALTQWQDQTSTFAGLPTTSQQRLSRYGVDFFLRGGLSTGFAFSPQVTTTGPTVTRAEVFTAYANFVPHPRFFFTSTYTRTQTVAPGSTTVNDVIAVFARYAPHQFTEYQAIAQFNDTRFSAFPASNTYVAIYQITATFRF